MKFRSFINIQVVQLVVSSANCETDYHFNSLLFCLQKHPNQYNGTGSTFQVEKMTNRCC
jgi:hypothetical protein